MTGPFGDGQRAKYGEMLRCSRPSVRWSLTHGALQEGGDTVRGPWVFP